EEAEGKRIQQANFSVESHQPVENNQRFLLDKDVVVYWRLAQNLPGSVDLVAYRAEGAKRGTYMMTVTPGDDLAKIAEGRDWAFVLDMSGSMSGKYSTLVDGVQRALKSLNRNDRFRLIRFDDSTSEVTSDWENATPQNVKYWGDELAKTYVRGGTNLYAGLKKGLDTLDADRTGAIILVTDGEANVGVTEKKAFLKLMEGRDVRLFTAVMGNGANRPLLNSMAETSHGFAVSVSNSDDIAGKLLEFTSKVSHQAFHDVELKVSGVKTSDQTPSKPTTLYRGEQMVIFGHYWGSGEAKVTLQGKVSGERKVYQSTFAFPETVTSNPEIERLWAYAHILELQKTIDYLGEEGDYKDAIVDLAVEHGLVTNHTSMVVMRDEQFEQRGIKRSNRKRLEVEQQAASNRAAAPVQNRRVDTQQPMFKSSRSTFSGGGGGAFGLELLPLVLLILLVHFRRRKESEMKHS
ncbi:MAG: VWA domain-containing protein, partial [Thiotrichaceae bacterium]